MIMRNKLPINTGTDASQCPHVLARNFPWKQPIRVLIDESSAPPRDTNTHWMCPGRNAYGSIVWSTNDNHCPIRLLVFAFFQGRHTETISTGCHFWVADSNCPHMHGRSMPIVLCPDFNVWYIYCPFSCAIADRAQWDNFSGLALCLRCGRCQPKHKQTHACVWHNAIATGTPAQLSGS